MHCKSLYLLSFSLAFLTNAMAREYLYESAAPQYLAAEEDDDENTNGFYEDGEYFADAGDGQSQMDLESEDCVSPFHRVHIGLRHNEARGIGYSDGYTTLEAFGIYDRYSQYFMPFFDLRGHVFNNGKLAGNVGIGERTLIPSINHTFGSYLYYDVRRVGKGLTVNQLSPGIELVGKRMEYRINGYFPVGNDEGHKYGYKFHEFDGHHIILKSKQYQAMKGFDAEVGAHVTQSTKYDLYTAAGSYYVQSSHAHSWGGRTRLLGRYKEYVSLEAAYSYDNLFRSVIEGSIAVTLPLGGKVKRKGQGCPKGLGLLLSRASFAPSRFEIPIVKKVHPRDKAINPATHKPWTVWFVNNLSSSAGTFHSPFPTLLAAQNASSPNDMIYVYPGDGTTTGMSSGITLQDGQYFFGSGTKQYFPTTKGTVSIPVMSASMPIISGPGGSAVFVRNMNTVSGFKMVNSGIVNFGVTLSNNGFTAANNVMTGANYNAIVFNGTGPVNIYNNQIASTTQTQSGILLRTVTGSLMTGKVSNNSVSGMQLGIALAETSTLNTGSFHMTIEGNSVLGSGVKGIGVTVTTPSQINITGNTVNVSTISPSSSINASMTGSLVISSNSVNAGLINGINYGPVGGNLSAAIRNNVITIDSNSGVGFDISSVSGLTNCTSLSNNTVINGSTLHPAFSFSDPANSTFNIEAFNNNVGTGLEMIFGLGTINFVKQGTCSN